jgi:HEAT repeat protein
MKRMGLFLHALLLLACAYPARDAAAQADEVRRLREELIKARLENLDLKLRLARQAARPEDELRLLEEALDSEFAEVAAAAFRELSALPEERRKAAGPAVLKRFAAGKEPFRLQAVAFLGRVSSAEAAQAVLGATRDPSPAVRKAAASALKDATDEAALRALLALVEDADPGVRIATLEALGVAKREIAVAPLVGRLAAEADEAVLEKIVYALGAIGARDAVDPLLRVLDRAARDAIRWACINSLGRIGDPRAAAHLRPFLAETYPLDVRVVAIEAVGKMKDAASVPRLGEILRQDRDEKIRQAAATSLGLMAPADAIEPLLLPSYLDERETDPVRRSVWTAMLAITGESFAANEKLVMTLLAKGRRADAEQVCTARVHELKPEGEWRDRALAVERAVADACFEGKDPRAALPHYRQILTLAPDRLDAERRVAECYLELKDFENQLKTLKAIDARLVRGDDEWWKNRRAIVSALVQAKDPEPLIEEAHALLLMNPPPHPEERRKFLEQALRTGALRLVFPLGERDETARKAALDAVRRQGKRIILALAAEVEETSRASTAILEAAGAITGAPVEPGAATDLRARVAAWRAWYDVHGPKR